MHKAILAIETTGSYCSVALLDDENTSFHQSVRKRSHADELLGIIDDLLNKASMTIQECGTIAVNVGPGSFTGIRIGIAVAQGLAFGAGISTCAISGFQAMVEDARQRIASTVSNEGITNNPGRVDMIWAALLHAREDEFYFAEYRIDARGYPVLKDNERVITASEINEWVSQRLTPDQTMADICFVGEAWHKIPLPRHANGKIVLTDVNANAVAAVAIHKLDQQMTMNPEALQPSYLKDEMHYRTVNDDSSSA